MKVIAMVNKVFLISIIICLFYGCTDFLTEHDRSANTKEDYFTKPQDATSIVNTLYASTRFIASGGAYYGESQFMLLIFPTGLAKTEVAQSIYNNNLISLNYDTDNGYFNSWWTNCYKAIANADLAIEKIPSIPDMDINDQKRLLGEAHFFRAFYYFYLVRLFGDVPLIKKPIDANSKKLYPKRTSQDSVYTLIVNDLKVAESSGLPHTSSEGRVSEGAVKTLLSKVYLTMAGYPLNKGVSYYKKSAQEAKEVIDAGWYHLFGDYNDLHDPDIKNTGGFIFQAQFKIGIATNDVFDFFLPRYKGIAVPGVEEFGSVEPVKDFIESYNKSDKRIKEQEFYYTQYPSYDNSKDTVEFGSPMIYKFFDKSAVLHTAQSDMNWTYYRYAEVLLIYAEASNEANNGPTKTGYNAINKVRERSGLNVLNNLDKTEFRHAVWRERYHELVYEGKIWFDMIRTRKVLNLKTNTFDNFVGHKFTNGATLEKKNLLFPIPKDQIQVDPKMVQNPGYD